jgi:hypothetical protein
MKQKNEIEEKLIRLLESKNKVSFEESWEKIIDIICNEILNKKNYNIKKMPELIKNMRDLLYQLFITNIDFNTIILSIMNNIKYKINDNIIKYKIIEETSKFENRIAQGTRHIVHLEAYLIKLIQILNI